MDQQEVYLGVNIDHVATLRQARLTRYPEPLQAALLAEEAGADGITAHLREDRRHIQDRDIHMLKDVIETRLNLEMAVTDEMMDIAVDVKPHYCCLVPEKREELTTEGGLDVISNQEKVKDACAKLADAGIIVSLFIDADERQIETAVACDAPCIEIHTGQYADATDESQRMTEFERIVSGVLYAKKLGLQVNAGHGLNYHNVKPIARIKEITELNIGHAIVARAVFVGFKAAVFEMKQLMLSARHD